MTEPATQHESPAAEARAAEGACAFSIDWLRAEIGDEARGRTGEGIVAHAAGTVAILEALGADEPTRIAAALFGGGDRAIDADRIEARFGADARALVDGIRRLLRLREIAFAAVPSAAPATEAAAASQLETLRRMLLAMAADIRVVLLRLASRLQTLRHYAAAKREPDRVLATESLEVLAPLANRLGLWQLKWEIEDLAFRFLDPELYRTIARLLEDRRVERERFVADAIARLREELGAAGVEAQVSGRPKHIYSIASKMRAKRLQFHEVQDLRAFRVIVDDIRQCYTVLGIVHTLWQPVPREFDDYIARPKPNGYRSLHTVVIGDDDRPFEIQIRTREMHEHAEYGVAAHWRYKERTTGLAGAQSAAARPGDAQRIAWVRQLLAWQRDMGERLGSGGATGLGGDERIYVLTPQARVVELPLGATPLDFAYHVHTSLGHRCRGARVDGQMVPLNTPLANGQTVEVIASKSAADGPSRDWLNSDLRYLASPRARAKVRQWFHALDIERDAAAGRTVVEKVLAREGRTAVPFDEIAHRLGFPEPQHLFVAVAREEVGPRALEEAVRSPTAPAPDAAAEAARDDADALARLVRGKPSAPASSSSGVLVVGVDVMSQLARCCRPVPPDPIRGFVTRGRGISVHRADCRSFAELARRSPERVLDAAWDGRAGAPAAAPRRYPVDLVLRANDRPGLLRDVSDVLARDRLNVTAVQTLTRGDIASMRFTVEVAGREQAQTAIAALQGVAGVIDVSRR